MKQSRYRQIDILGAQLDTYAVVSNAQLAMMARKQWVPCEM